MPRSGRTKRPQVSAMQTPTAARIAGTREELGVTILEWRVVAT
jgi:hypothetical protein